MPVSSSAISINKNKRNPSVALLSNNECRRVRWSATLDVDNDMTGLRPPGSVSTHVHTYNVQYCAVAEAHRIILALLSWTVFLACPQQPALDIVVSVYSMDMRTMRYYGVYRDAILLQCNDLVPGSIAISEMICSTPGLAAKSWHPKCAQLKWGRWPCPPLNLDETASC